ncbi:MAG: DeoR/GlpR family DNA-binding transcription regulator [Anaerostipes sp.]|nr:DeoR/GlpR family DNA-binding transcription regulator [Anaerostipes sp.]
MKKKEKRLAELYQYINSFEYISINDLMMQFNVSKSTIVRDLDMLARQELIERFHGGARALSDERVTKFNIREKINEEKKISIAREAAKLVKNHDTIYLDTGSTCFLLYKEITATDITIFTPNLAIINYTPRSNISHLYALEGEVSQNNYSLGGNLTLENMKRIFPEKMFFSAVGLKKSNSCEIQCANEIQVSTIRTLCEMQGEKILLLDSSKIGVHKTFQGNSIKDIDTVIVDNSVISDEISNIKFNTKNLIIANES